MPRILKRECLGSWTSRYCDDLLPNLEMWSKWSGVNFLENPDIGQVSQSTGTKDGLIKSKCTMKSNWAFCRPTGVQKSEPVTILRGSICLMEWTFYIWRRRDWILIFKWNILIHEPVVWDHLYDDNVTYYMYQAHSFEVDWHCQDHENNGLVAVWKVLTWGHWTEVRCLRKSTMTQGLGTLQNERKVLKMGTILLDDNTELGS